MTILTAPLLLILGVAASARLTRIIVVDEIGHPLRSWIARHTKEPEFYASGTQIPHSGSKIAYLFHCVWCTGLWIAAGVSALLWFGGLAAVLPLDWWAGIPAVTLALGWGVGVAQRLESSKG